MGLEIILGLNKTGKSKYIYDLIDEDIKNDIYPILFVPSQERVKAEESYIDYQGKAGLIGFNVTTISSYINDNISRYSGDIFESYVTKLDRKILLMQALRECSSDIKLFKNVLNKDGFFDTLNIYMDIFRKSNMTLEKVENIKVENKILKQKITEIALIYNAYVKKLNERFIDDIGKNDIFIENILGKFLNVYGKNIYFDGYNNFTESEYKFIEKLCVLGANLKITLNTDIQSIEDIYSNNTSDIFEVSNKTYLRILKICNNLNIGVNTKIMQRSYLKSSGELQHLSNNLFLNLKSNKSKSCDESINLNITNNNYTEVCFVAKEICKLIQNGYIYDDFVIFTTNIDEYEHIIKKIFAEYNIPAYIDKKYKIINSKLVSYILLYLDILQNGLNLENGILILKLGLNNINYEEVCELENYLDEFNVKKYLINKEMTLNSDTKNIYDLESINKTIKKLKETFNSSNLKKELIAKDIVENIYNHLMENGVFGNYKNYVYTDNFSSFDENLMSFSIEKQVWGKVKELFDSISKVFGNNKCTIGEFCIAFKSSIKDINIKSIPPTMDQVSVLDINVSKTSMKKVMFFIGVNEDKFPKKVEQDVLFSDNDLELLRNSNLDIRESSISKFNMQLFNIYIAISNVIDKLYICIPSSDISGKSQRVSSIVSSIRKITGAKLIGDVAEEKKDIYDEYSKDKIFQFVLDFLRDESTNESKDVILATADYLLNDEKYTNIIKYKKNDDNLKEHTLDSIYDKNFDMSISKLEQFKKCPFSYYMKYCLKIDKKNVFEIKSIDTGNFMHEVIEEFSKMLMEKNVSFASILTDENKINEQYEDILDKIINEKLEYKMRKYKDSIKYEILRQKLQNTMKRVITIVAISFSQSNFIPYGYEVEFKNNGTFLPIVIKLDETRKMNLIGKIDRIDVMELDDKKYVRVVDYKSSSRSLSLDDIKTGISLQLATYISSFIENKKDDNYIPAGLLYFNLSNKLVNLKEYINDNSKIEEACIKALRLNGIFLRDVKVLENMDNKINEKSGKLIDISLRNINSSSKALDEEEFTKLCQDIKDILKDIGKEVIDGIVSIKPNKKSEPCKFCDYSTICRKNINV